MTSPHGRPTSPLGATDAIACCTFCGRPPCDVTVPTTSCVPPPTSGKRTVTVAFSRRSPRVVPVQTVLNGIAAGTAVNPKLSTPTVDGMNTAGTPRGAVFVGPVAVTLNVIDAILVNVPFTAPARPVVHNRERVRQVTPDVHRVPLTYLRQRHIRRGRRHTRGHRRARASDRRARRARIVRRDRVRLRRHHRHR